MELRRRKLKEKKKTKKKERKQRKKEETDEPEEKDVEKKPLTLDFGSMFDKLLKVHYVLLRVFHMYFAHFPRAACSI